jgi:hypothetical protein
MHYGAEKVGCLVIPAGPGNSEKQLLLMQDFRSTAIHITPSYALYFATFQLPRPRGWNQPLTVGHYWRAALVVFFNYGVDTGTVFKSSGFHEPILWRHVSWRPEPPNGQGRESRYGWLYYRRVKTKKQFYRPMNRVVQAHLKSIRPADPQPDQPVFDCGSSRPNSQFQLLCQ